MKEKKSFFQKIASGFPDREESRNIRITDDDYDTDMSHSNSWDTAQEELDGELSIDMYQTEKDLVIEAMIAGVRPEDIQVNITRDIVTLSGKREANKSVIQDDYFYRELYWGTFSRSIMLPHEIDIESAEAIEKHGMLIIKMPKIDKGRQSKLKVKSL
jgi:HSP20 family molecular chaperone IbpA